MSPPPLYLLVGSCLTIKGLSDVKLANNNEGARTRIFMRVISCGNSVGADNRSLMALIEIAIGYLMVHDIGLLVYH